MSASNKPTLADSGANERPPILENRNYIPWDSRFRRFLDNKLEEGEQMWHSIEKGPYVRKCEIELKEEGESLESVYERLTTLVNIMDRNNVRPISVSINTKFLNFLQLEWSKYVTMEINANMVFMAQIEKVLLESDESSSSAEETIAMVAYYTSESESEYEFEASEYYDNSTNYGLFVNNDDDQE
nr:hypothetical protein [Tanacetum cinerariifolium]